MIDVEIDLEQKDASGAVDRGTKNLMEDAMMMGYSLAFELMPEDRGTLRASAYEPEWKSDGSIAFGFQADHAAPMEFGTQPFQPPLEPLLNWSERVTGSKGLGYYVALHKIPEEGIDAQPYARPGAEKAKQYLQSKGFSDYISDEL